MAKGIGGLLAEMGLKPAQAVEIIDGFLAQLRKDAKEEQPQWALVSYETNEDNEIVDESELFVYESRECALIEARQRSEREESANVFYDVVEISGDDEEEEETGNEGDESDDASDPN